ncbi:lysophospholipid acyltransferase family protein [Georgenia daeguensis]|uniref:lysophospholipid acyltransferase family protein n=1 Tax=Georgenia daeguensis TaxID=908355 RepID=UPI0031E77942
MQPRKQSGVYRFLVSLLRPAMTLMTRRTWRGGEHLPAVGGFVAVANHASNMDPLTVAHFLYDHGAAPKFLAKSSLFEVPVLGRLLAAADQIPVYRGTARAGDSLVAAEKAVRRGECVVIFPEGTFTRDPDLWPMTARTGAARLALSTRVPVIPVTQWGAHRIMPRYTARFRPFPRTPVTVVAGPPVGLEDLYGRPVDQEVLREATTRIMAALTAQLAEIRGERPPARPYDVRRDGDPRAAHDAARAERRAARRERRAARDRRLAALRERLAPLRARRSARRAGGRP